MSGTRNIFILVGVFLLIAIGSGLYFYRDMFLPKKAPVTYDTLLNQNKNFAQAVDIIQNGGDLNQAQTLLQQDLVKAEQNNQYDVAGVIKLWLALAQSPEVNNPTTLTKYVQTLTEVAADDRYGARTRQYAFALIGSIYSRLLALNNPSLLPVLDVPFKNPVLAHAQVKNTDGTTNYRQSIITLLGEAPGSPNPLVLARTASIMIRGVELGEVPEKERQTYILRAVQNLQTAHTYVADIQQNDTAKLYLSYLFLVAQAYGKIATIDNGVYASTVQVDVDDLYTDAIVAASTDTESQSSARYGYAKYLVLRYGLSSNHTAAETAALTKKLDSLFQAFIDNSALKNTQMFTIIMSTFVDKKSANSEDYQVVQMLQKYSPVFKKLLAQQ